MGKHLTAWIDGKRSEGAASAGFDLVSPVTGETLYRIVENDDATIDAAVQNAHRAYLAHRRSTITQRVAWLEALAKAFEQDAARIADMIVHTIGKLRRKPRCVAGGRVHMQLHRRAADPARRSPAARFGAGHLGFARRIPYGVVAAITPFNAPANLLVQKLAPALATGNAIVVKPHPTGIEVALAFAELAKKAGLPDGLCNGVTGDRDAALKLVAHPKVSVVSLTGGVVAARSLAAAAGPKKFCAELGSNAANPVLADANIEDAATKIAAVAFEASGQQCISAQRVIVEQPVFERFLETFVAAAKKLKVGDPQNGATMVNVAATQRVMSMIADAEAHGARIALKPQVNGAYVSPGLIVEAPGKARVLCEEAFGPIVVVQPARDLDDALAQANDSQFGLQGACFTSSLDTALRIASQRISTADRCGSTRRAGSGSTCILSVGSRTAASAAKASATPWKSTRSSSSSGCARAVSRIRNCRTRCVLAR